MSIVNTKSGRYIKVIRELSVFHPNSVQVFFYSFGSRSEKEEYFARAIAVKAFLQNVDNYLASAGKELGSEIELYVEEKGIKELDMDALPAKFKGQMKFLSSLGEYASQVCFGWDKRTPLPKFKNSEKLHELGFDEKWLTPLPTWDISSVHTGVFTNQNFSYECLYRELKKIFKDDFVDC